MTKKLEIVRYRLEMDGPWELLDLSYFGRQYVQVYSLLYVLHVSADLDEFDDRVHHTFNAFPWRGGWSAVGFYESLRRAVPKSHQPNVVAISYRSPGYIDLALILSVALSIKWTVGIMCDTIDRIVATYKGLYQIASDRKILRRDVRQVKDLDPDDIKFAHDASAMLLRQMGLQDLHGIIDQNTQNPIATLKIVFSLHRRLRDLAKLQQTNKMNF